MVQGSGRVLLVEDDTQVRTLALRALRQAGYQVEPYESGEALLSQSERVMECDLLLTDVVMPGVDGATLARRALAIRPDLPVLFMSGYLDDKLSIFDLNQGSGFLAKPFTPVELQVSVAHILRN